MNTPYYILRLTVQYYFTPLHIQYTIAPEVLQYITRTRFTEREHRKGEGVGIFPLKIAHPETTATRSSSDCYWVRYHALTIAKYEYFSTILSSTLCNSVVVVKYDSVEYLVYSKYLGIVCDYTSYHGDGEKVEALRRLEKAKETPIIQSST